MITTRHSTNREKERMLKAVDTPPLEKGNNLKVTTFFVKTILVKPAVQWSTLENSEVHTQR